LMRARIYTILEVCFIAIFCFSLFKLGTIGYGYVKGDQLYKDSQKEFLTSEDSKSSLIVTVDFDALWEINKDIVGWIYSSDTPVNYPLLQTLDNSYYLKRTYNHVYSDFGSIFIDYRCNKDLTDLNTIIYGHNTKNGSMFGTFKKYKTKSYFDKHKYIYIFYPDKSFKYEVIAAYTVTTSDPVYTLNFTSDDEFKNWLNDVISNSEAETNKTEITGKEKIITFSTCTSRSKTERFVVVAEQIEIVEK